MFDFTLVVENAAMEFGRGNGMLSQFKRHKNIVQVNAIRNNKRGSSRKSFAVKAELFSGGLF